MTVRSTELLKQINAADLLATSFPIRDTSDRESLGKEGDMTDKDFRAQAVRLARRVLAESAA